MAALRLLRDLIYQGQFLYRAVLLAILLGIACLFFMENGKEAKGKILSLFRQKWLALFLFYTAFILTIAVFVRGRTNPYRSVFKNFSLYHDGLFNYDFVENTLVFVPISFLYLQAFKPARPLRPSLALSAGMSLFIELSQLIFWLGEFQFSDLIYNTLGGLIGCGLWCLLAVIRRK